MSRELNTAEKDSAKRLPVMLETPPALIESNAPTHNEGLPPAQPADVTPALQPLRPRYIPVKMAIDWMIALGIFIVTAPLIGLLLLVVRITSPGPALYKQKRMGRFGKPFNMYKIRTMTHNCEAKTGAVWSGPNDKRVTRVGRFLRDAHLDELPQLFNVLRCEMSLIGPRPERPELVEQIKRRLPRYPQRVLVRPGLAGFAQIQHPADLDLDHVRRKLMYDLYYVREISPQLDLRILFGTFFYMIGVTLKAMGKFIVKAHGDAAEREHEDMELLEDDTDSSTQLRATGT
jgi:lipopolysaccharide/colanic/teichoic acid biosynthesis glycosyltransferase